MWVGSTSAFRPLRMSGHRLIGRLLAVSGPSAYGRRRPIADIRRATKIGRCAFREPIPRGATQRCWPHSRQCSAYLFTWASFTYPSPKCLFTLELLAQRWQPASSSIHPEGSAATPASFSGSWACGFLPSFCLVECPTLLL